MTVTNRQPSLTAGHTEHALAEARDLKKWWDDVQQGKASVTKFELLPSFPGGHAVWGFFGEATIAGKKVPVMGDVGDYFFDGPSVPADKTAEGAAWIARQIEEFALHYWLRSQAWAEPQPYPELDRLQPPFFLRAFDLAPPPDTEVSGMANYQRTFKLRDGGKVGNFCKDHATAVVDLNQLFTRYQWITLERSLLDFDLALGTTGDNSVTFSVPLRTTMNLILSSDLVIREHNPDPETLGRFGYAAALARNPDEGLLAIGPDKIQPGLEYQTLRVLKTGEVRLQITTILARPEKILNLSYDPFEWVAEMADRLTGGSTKSVTEPIKNAMKGLSDGGMRVDPVFGPLSLFGGMLAAAAKSVGVEKEHFEKQILAQDAIGLRDSLVGTRQTWMQVSDWLDKATIPDWIAAGDVVEKAEQ